MCQKIICMSCGRSYNCQKKFFDHICDIKKIKLFKTKETKFYECFCGYKSKYSHNMVKHMKKYKNKPHKKREYKKNFTPHTCEYCNYYYSCRKYKNIHEKTKKHIKNKKLHGYFC